MTELTAIKERVLGLVAFYNMTQEMDPGVQQETIEVLNTYIDVIEEQELALSRKRKSPNKSGVLMLDPDTFEIIAEFETQKAALEHIGKEGKSGVGDALNGRTKSHNAYGYAWSFKNEYEEVVEVLEERRAAEQAAAVAKEQN